MLSLLAAQRLRAAGLPWKPAPFDFFAVPERDLDDRVFVIADIPVQITTLQGQRVFTFEGALEWALDYVLTTDAVWLPTESQLRQELELRLPEHATPRISLVAQGVAYRCEFMWDDQPVTATADTAEDAYAAGLLYLLENSHSS